MNYKLIVLVVGQACIIYTGKLLMSGPELVGPGHVRGVHAHNVQLRSSLLYEECHLDSEIKGEAISLALLRANHAQFWPQSNAQSQEINIC